MGIKGYTIEMVRLLLERENRKDSAFVAAIIVETAGEFNPLPGRQGVGRTNKIIYLLFDRDRFFNAALLPWDYPKHYLFASLIERTSKMGVMVEKHFPVNLDTIL